MFLYVTADKIGTETGGGVVTYHESHAMEGLGSSVVILDDHSNPEDVWEADRWALDQVKKWVSDSGIRLAHFYSGTFTETIKYLKSNGVKITYTAAAHDVEVSKREHEALGISYNYPHLTDPELFKRYLEGYKLADILICPSSHSLLAMKNFGCKGDSQIIPHGTDVPESVVYRLPGLPFVVGYLGAYGPDKGVKYLLQAWELANLQGAELWLAGGQSQSPYVGSLIRLFAEKTSKSIKQVGWVPKVGDFYNNIDLYVQPSATEGFGIEVLEAMAHGRPVLCSNCAGAADVFPTGHYQYNDVEYLKILLQWNASIPLCWKFNMGMGNRAAVQEFFTWEKIEKSYQNVWRQLLGEQQ